jgi:hypothetical protein
MRIRIEYAYGYAYDRADIWLVADPGKTYRLKWDWYEYKFRVWFIDDATGTPVGGVVGSQDEPS